MNISLELIDEMRKRTNCSYEEAKTLLEKNNGNLVDAIVEFEQKHSHGFRQNHCHHNSNFGEKLKELVHKGFSTRFIIEKGESTILNISVNILILIVICTMPIFWLYPIALATIYLMGFKISLKKGKGQEIDFNKFVDGIGNKVRTAADKMSEKPARKDDGTSSLEKKDDDTNEITIE